MSETQWPKDMKQPEPRNKQPAEKSTHSINGPVQVFDIWPTIQGEGPYAGSPAVFIRLSGCNLQCPLCDTEYTSRRTVMNPLQVVNKVRVYGQKLLIVITGGEPFRQDITKMVRALLNAGHNVQIETNGTYYLQDFPYNKIVLVCSPKTPTINMNIRPDYYKYILDADHIDPDDGLPTSALGMPGKPARPRPHEYEIPVYIQPLDEEDEEKNKRHIQATVDSVMRFDHRLCLQIHKYIGMK